jgi:NAD(P)-dependent dehydrogenase (short-subunit alcohol dehydrogenase family)
MSETAGKPRGAAGAQSEANAGAPGGDAKGSLAGRHALVTGGGRGLGAAIARAFVAEGMRVTLVGRNSATLTRQAEALGALSDGSSAAGTCGFQVADVADNRAVEAAFGAAREARGPIDVLVANAGQAESAPFKRTDPALWERMIAVNLTGTYHCDRAALPDMLAAGWGRIVHVASTAGLVGYPYVAAYCAAKHGVIGLTRALALELATSGITVNAVCPGYAATDLVEVTLERIVAKTGRTREAALVELTARNPQKRLVTPEEVANAVLWLCRPGSEAVTGQAIAIAGGEVM